MDGGSTENAGDGSSMGMGGMEAWATDTTIAAWCLVLFGSVLLNAILLIAFIRRPGLRTISNRFVMNLIASNLLAIFVLTSLLITNTCQLITYSRTPSVCALSEGATALVTTSSILSVLLIGVDQYLAVVDPLRYRTRIDKLKCGLLILAVWLIALAFGALASFNPQPRGLWKLCSPGTLDEISSSERQTDELQYRHIERSNETRDSKQHRSVVQSDEEAAESTSLKVTYGMVYSLVYTLFGYLVPFAAMCWIYVCIYMAARNNSERTRRTGSRPMLTSGSFSDEGGHRPDCASLEDVRAAAGRMPKISSLSSIDENSEVSPSQAEPPVIFTVGNQDAAKVPSQQSVVAVVVDDSHQHHHHHHHHHDDDDESRKNSQDLMYEEMMLGCCKHPYEYEDDDLEQSSDEDEEVHREFEPLSSGDRAAQGSVSVNFDLGESEQSRMLNGQPMVHSPAHPPPIVTVTPPGQKPTVQARGAGKSAHSYIHNLKHRISNGSLFKYREETRAARISALVIVMGLICWTPYAYALLWRNLQSQSIRSDELDAVALGFLVLATYVSPLLFGYRSKRVKRELRKFFCFKRELSYKNNRSLMAKKVLRRRHSGLTILGQLAGAEANPAIEHSRYNIFNCVYGRNRWPKEKVQFVQVPDTALAVETCRSSFSSGASTQISSTSTDEC